MIQTDLRDPRSIRVFASSTFRDMKAARDALMNHTWTELRRGMRWNWHSAEYQRAEDPRRGLELSHTTGAPYNPSR